jgi:dienelactone hydrolase
MALWMQLQNKKFFTWPTADHAEQLGEALTAAGVQHTIECYSAAHGFAVPDNPPTRRPPTSGTGRR